MPKFQQGPSLTDVTRQQLTTPMAEPQFQPFQFESQAEIEQAAKSPVFLANKPAMAVMKDREQMAEANPLTWRQDETTGKYGVFEKDAPFESKPLATFDTMNQAAAAIKTRGAASDALIMPTKEAEQAFGEMSPEQQQVTLEGSTGAQFEQNKKNEERTFAQKYGIGGDFDKTMGELGLQIGASTLEGIKDYLKGGEHMRTMEYLREMQKPQNVGRDVEVLKEIDRKQNQALYDAQKQISERFDREIKKNNISTDAFKNITEGNWERVPESVLYTVGSVIMQVAPSIATYGTSTYFQTLPQVYKAGVDARAKELGITPEEVIRSGQDGKTMAKVVGLTQAALERVGAGMVSSSIAKQGGYTAVRDWVIGKLGKSTWSKAAGRGAGIGFASVGEGLTGGLQEGTSVLQEGKMANKGILESFEGQGGRILSAAGNEAIGGFGAAGLGRTFAGRGNADSNIPPPPPTSLGGIRTQPVSDGDVKNNEKFSKIEDFLGVNSNNLNLQSGKNGEGKSYVGLAKGLAAMNETNVEFNDEENKAQNRLDLELEIGKITRKEYSERSKQLERSVLERGLNEYKSAQTKNEIIVGDVITLPNGKNASVDQIRPDGTMLVTPFAIVRMNANGRPQAENEKSVVIDSQGNIVNNRQPTNTPEQLVVADTGTENITPTDTEYVTVTDDELNAFQTDPNFAENNPERVAGVQEDADAVRNGELTLEAIEDPNYRTMVQMQLDADKQQPNSSVGKTFTLKDTERISDGTGLQRKGSLVNDPELVAKQLSVGDKLTFFQERERTGTWDGNKIIEDGTNNPWGLLGVLSDGWVINNGQQANDNTNAGTSQSVVDEGVGQRTGSENVVTDAGVVPAPTGSGTGPVLTEQSSAVPLPQVEQTEPAQQGAAEVVVEPTPTDQATAAQQIAREFLNIDRLVAKGFVNYVDDKTGKPCAKFGMRDNAFSRGSKWEIVKDLKGYATHEKGGVDLTIDNKGVRIGGPDSKLYAADGLLMPNNGEPIPPQKKQQLAELERQKFVEYMNHPSYKERLKKEVFYNTFDPNNKKHNEILEEEYARRMKEISTVPISQGNFSEVKGSEIPYAEYFGDESSYNTIPGGRKGELAKKGFPQIIVSEDVSHNEINTNPNLFSQVVGHELGHSSHSGIVGGRAYYNKGVPVPSEGMVERTLQTHSDSPLMEQKSAVKDLMSPDWDMASKKQKERIIQLATQKIGPEKVKQILEAQARMNAEYSALKKEKGEKYAQEKGPDWHNREFMEIQNNYIMDHLDQNATEVATRMIGLRKLAADKFGHDMNEDFDIKKYKDQLQEYFKKNKMIDEYQQLNKTLELSDDQINEMMKYIAKNNTQNREGNESKQYAANGLLVPNDEEPISTQPIIKKPVTEKVLVSVDEEPIVVQEDDKKPVPAKPIDKKPVAPQPKPVKKARVYVRENDPVFNKEAKRSLPLLEQRYGKGNVEIIQIPQGNQKLLQAKLAEDLNADTFIYDHSGDDMLGVPLSGAMKNSVDLEDAFNIQNKAMEESLGRKTTEDEREALYYKMLEQNIDHTGTWTRSFPENYKGCAYWGSCNFDTKAGYFTQESKIPSYSTNFDKWKGVNSAVKPIKTDEDFLNQFYFGAKYNYHQPTTEEQ